MLQLRHILRMKGANMAGDNTPTYKDIIKTFGNISFKVTTMSDLWSQIVRQLDASHLCEQMHVGKLDIDVITESNIFDIDGSDEIFTYDTGLPLNEDGVVSQSYSTISTGKGVVHAYPLEGHFFSDEDMEVLLSFGNIIHLFMSRLRLSINVEKSKYIDMMTGLYNTAGVRMEGKKLEAVGELYYMACIFINLKGFSYINKRIGMRNGDEVMRRYAKLISTLVSMNRGVAARLGGDRFFLIIPKTQLESALAILEDVQVDIQIFDHTEHINVNAWIGVFETTETDGIDDAMNGAAIANGVAKSTGSYHAVYFKKNMMEHSLREKRIVAGFDDALKNGEFFPYYQPKVALDTGEMVAAEALARWHNHGELLLPDEFISALAENGKMIELDLFMLESVCRDIRSWIYSGINPVPVSVNYAKENLIHRQLAEETIAIIKKYDIDPSLIEIELTELANYEDPQSLREFIELMHENGIRVSMDDFGTGYTSLNLLKDMSFDVVKMDQSIISRISSSDDTKDKILLKHMLLMLSELGTEIVVEGVETCDQLDFIRSIDDKVFIQGFLYDEAMGRDDFEKRLKDKQYSI